MTTRNAALKTRIADMARIADEERVHVVGTVVALESQQSWHQGMLDDGTGTIEFRVFGPEPRTGVGEQVRIVGKTKTFGSTRYLTADVLGKIRDPRWIALWQLEVGENKQDPRETILESIRSLDDGTGAPIEQVLGKTAQAERIIEQLKNAGEIFETRPGRLKVLE